MSITKKNLYLPARDLTNLAANMDLIRIGFDECHVTVAFGTPNVASIKVGSLIEANGDLYTVEAADYVFNMTAGHTYIEFNGTVFRSSATKGTWSTAKMGYYNGLYRTIKSYVNLASSAVDFDESLFTDEHIVILSDTTAGGGGDTDTTLVHNIPSAKTNNRILSVQAIVEVSVSNSTNYGNMFTWDDTDITCYWPIALISKPFIVRIVYT